jgi:hypothetical protein
MLRWRILFFPLTHAFTVVFGERPAFALQQPSKIGHRDGGFVSAAAARQSAGNYGFGRSLLLLFPALPEGQDSRVKPA